MDYLHLEMRFTYRKMKSPSMQLDAVDNEGAVMIYRSGRSGFKRYLTGQLLEIARQFYDSELKVTVLESKNDTPGNPANLNGGINEVVVKFRLDFDNREYVRSQHSCVTKNFMGLIGTCSGFFQLCLTAAREIIKRNQCYQNEP